MREGETETGGERGEGKQLGGRTGHYSGQSMGRNNNKRQAHVQQNTDAIHNFQHYKQ